MNVSISLPRSWKELTQFQLHYVLSLIAMGMNFNEIKTYCLFRWSGMKVVTRYGRDFLISFKGKRFTASPLFIASAIDCLGFLEDMPDYPVRLIGVKKGKPLDASFQEVPFKKFIICDNLYQGYIVTHNEDLLESMGKILYRNDNIALDNAQRIGVFYWWNGLKAQLAAEFYHFFAPAASSDEPADKGRILKEAMNAQIRALTKGDITKEKEVLAMDTWRALTELDALAFDYQEMERKYPSK